MGVYDLIHKAVSRSVYAYNENFDSPRDAITEAIDHECS